MDSSVAEMKFAEEHGHRLLSQFAYRVSRCVKSPGPEAVHELRVAIRRFTQAMIVFESCFPPKQVKRVRRRLRRIMKLAGEVRDCDIAAKLMSKLGRDDVLMFQRALKMQRKQAADILVTALSRSIDRKWSAKWRSRVLAVAPSNNHPSSERDIADSARRALPKMAKAYFECGNRAAAAKTSSEELHQFRIASKRLRYTLELFATAYGPSLAQLLDQIKAVQTLLGDANDCQMVQDLLSRMDEGRTLIARLKKRQRRKVREFRVLWSERLATPESAHRWLAYLNDFAGRKSPRKKPAGHSAGSNAAGRAVA